MHLMRGRAEGEAVRDAERIVDFVRALDGFEIVEDLALPYNHMGATITDGVLQAGLRYETVVWPRVQHVLTIPEAATTSGFLAVLLARGGEEVVHWTHPDKLRRMVAVAEFLVRERIETEADMRTWLCDGPAAPTHAGEFGAVRGIGPKTIDYFKILCGEQDTAAVDLHLTRFLEAAGVRVTSYVQARRAIADAAIELGLPAAQLDHSIWTFMSNAGKTW